MASNSTTAAAGASSKTKKVATLSMWAMAIMIVTNIVSMRGLASQAEYGYTSIFYYVLAALIFLLPFSLVCAELASHIYQIGRSVPLGCRGFRTQDWLDSHVSGMANGGNLVPGRADVLVGVSGLHFLAGEL